MNNIERMELMLDGDFVEMPDDIETLGDFDKWLSDDTSAVYELEDGKHSMRLVGGNSRSSKFTVMSNGKTVATGVEVNGSLNNIKGGWTGIPTKDDISRIKGALRG